MMNAIQKDNYKALVAEFVRRGQIRFPTPTGDRLISTPEDLELERERQDKEREAIGQPKKVFRSKEFDGRWTF